MGFKCKKKFGQNFIYDKNILNNIVKSANVEDNCLILEVGPGSGNLTEYLLNTNNKVICFEIDKDLKDILDDRFKNKVDIIYGDFLKLDINKIIKDYTYNKLYLISNLPYYITTPIITKIIEDKIPVDKMVIMVQKEVADRLNAKEGSKEYNSLTIYLNYYFNINKLFDVSRNVFRPIPNVDSAVISLTKKDNIEEVNPIFFKLVRDSFQFKRKTLRNNLKDYDLNKIEEILKKYNLDLSIRAEQIPISIFIDIANNL